MSRTSATTALLVCLFLVSPACEPDRDAIVAEVMTKVEAELLPKLEADLRADIAREVAAAETARQAGRLPVVRDMPRTADPAPAQAPARRGNDPRSGALPRLSDARVAARPVSDTAVKPVVEPAALGAETAVPPVAEPDVAAQAADLPVGSPSGYSIARHLITVGIDNREPARMGTSFSVSRDQTVHCYLEADNRDGPERKLTATWFHEGNKQFGTDLKIGPSPRWRTWARTRLQPEKLGAWRCDLVDAAGKTVSSAGFTVTE